MAAARPPDLRLAALRRFAAAITAFNVLGHAWLGFEQSIAQPLLGLAVAYGLELALEALAAGAEGRRARFAGGGLRPLVDFLLPAHITALSAAMLLYAGDRLLPIAFAVAAGIGSKAIFRAPVGGVARHFFNPSNCGITLTLLAFPWVGIAPPYMFTENLSGAGDWILPGSIVVSGSFLNARFTRRAPLILAWVGGFALQAGLRSALLGTPLAAAWLPMTGVAFLLFTFYMVTDPGTTPTETSGQVAFGLGLAAAYGTLMALHVVFGLFFALSLVCLLRGAALTVRSWAQVSGALPVPTAAASLGRRPAP